MWIESLDMQIPIVILITPQATVMVIKRISAASATNRNHEITCIVRHLGHGCYSYLWNVLIANAFQLEYNVCR